MHIIILLIFKQHSLFEMKEKNKNILMNFKINFFSALLIWLIALYTIMSETRCYIALSKVTKDLLKDLHEYDFAKIFNSTHFSCDKGNKILDMGKLNDDFCDCQDGSDENSKIVITYILFL